MNGTNSQKNDRRPLPKAQVWTSIVALTTLLCFGLWSPPAQAQDGALPRPASWVDGELFAGVVTPATFSPESPVGYDELFEQINSVPLLVLDDLGSESSTAWAEEKLYQIVVHRHEARLPTVITTVSTIEELEDTKSRIASRLVDGIVVNWVPISAPNYRDQRRRD